MKIDIAVLRSINQKTQTSIKILDRILPTITTMYLEELKHIRDVLAQSGTMLNLIVEREDQRNESEKSKRK